MSLIKNKALDFLIKEKQIDEASALRLQNILSLIEGKVKELTYLEKLFLTKIIKGKDL